MFSLKLPFLKRYRTVLQPTNVPNTKHGILGRSDLPTALREQRSQPPPQNTELLIKYGPHALWSAPPED